MRNDIIMTTLIYDHQSLVYHREKISTCTIYPAEGIKMGVQGLQEQKCCSESAKTKCKVT